jgi:hypothetical protein
MWKSSEMERIPGSARVARAGFGVAPKQYFIVRREDLT